MVIEGKQGSAATRSLKLKAKRRPHHIASKHCLHATVIHYATWKIIILLIILGFAEEKRILCVVGLWIRRFLELFSLFTVSCWVLIKIESHLQPKDKKDAFNLYHSSESTGTN